MYELMQIALMRAALGLSPTQERQVDDMLVHQGARATLEFLKPNYSKVVVG